VVFPRPDRALCRLCGTSGPNHQKTAENAEGAESNSGYQVDVALIDGALARSSIP